MDHSKWTPTTKRLSCDSIMMLSPLTKTPVRSNQTRFRTNYQNTSNSLSVLPNHITPPSGLTKFIARNPFEADLTNKLHISVMSPTVFSKVGTPSQKKSPGFVWSIDELALIQPAKIDELSVQQMHCSDPELEKNAQEAISKFFSNSQIIPSPFHIKINEEQKRIMLPTTPSRLHNKTSESLIKETRNNYAQTILTLPVNLPPEVEEALQPYFTFTEDQQYDNEEANCSNSSLRRKLFANHDESHNESSDSISLSPVKSEKSDFVSILNLSPAQSGVFFHGTPLRSCINSTLLKNCSQVIQRNFGSPLTRRTSSSPCDVSPISNNAFNMSCQSIKSRKSVTKLDFTKEMSIELESDEESNNISLRKNNQDHLQTTVEVTKMVASGENSKLECEDKENYVCNFLKSHNSKMVDEGKDYVSESYAIGNMSSGNYTHQTGFQSTQDTGYQTFSSSSNLTNTMDGYSNSMKHKLYWDDKITEEEDETNLTDWKKNLKNMISSTPSKLHKGLNGN
ncbi:protein aurora borealis [Trichogramma pretiosum]|uniref:protein aurora borealis n=1 Tax=Trichogramma pretiosum TaxID=7493 RepID=UPI0006C95DFC|nr:protein aurora borealis [Trichogramma pretiosum]